MDIKNSEDLENKINRAEQKYWGNFAQRQDLSRTDSRYLKESKKLEGVADSFYNELEHLKSLREKKES